MRSYLPARKERENLLWHWLLLNLFRAATGRRMIHVGNARRAENTGN